MKRSLFAAAVLAILAVPVICSAAPPRPGPYVSGFIGVSVPQDTDVTFTEFGGDIFNERVEFDPSIYIGGTGGFDFGYVRLEGELSYKQAEMSTITSTNLTSGGTTQFVNVDGRIGVLATMFNCFFDLHNNSPVTPYIGGGIGFAALYLDDTFGTIVNGPNAGFVTTLYWEDDDAVFAYQVGAGLEIALNRQLSLDVGYRFFGTDDADFTSQPFGQASLKLQSHNVAVGVRVKF